MLQASKNSTHQRILQLYPRDEPSKFFAMHNLGPLSKTNTGSKVFVMMMDRYSKLTRAIPTEKTIAKDVVRDIG